MRKSNKYILIFGLLILTIYLAYFFTIKYHQNIKSKQKFYCYQAYFGPPNEALVIEDLVYKDSLIKYYNEAEKGINPIFNFPLKTIPKLEPVYLIEYSNDSLVALVASYYDRGVHNGGFFNKYYVDVRTLHSIPIKRNKQ